MIPDASSRSRLHQKRTRTADAHAHADPEEASPAFDAEALKARPWRVARSLLKLRDQVDALAPKRRKTSDGTTGDAAHASRDSDHNPWVIDGGTGVVTAMDITHDPDRGCDAGRLAKAIQASRDRRVKYVIWNRKIMSSTKAPWTWREYDGTNPHTEHVHVSVRSRKSAYDDATAWRIGSLSDPAKPAQTLRLGDRGLEVVALQKALAEALERSLDADGVFGPATEDAVEDFQRRAKLEVDGIAGPKTMAALRKAASGAAEPVGAGAASSDEAGGPEAEAEASAAGTGAAEGRLGEPPTATAPDGVEAPDGAEGRDAAEVARAGADARRVEVRPGVRIGPVGRLLVRILEHYPDKDEIYITSAYRPGNGSHHGGLTYEGSPTAAVDVGAGGLTPAGKRRMRALAKWLYDRFAADTVELIHTTSREEDHGGFYVKNQRKDVGGDVYGEATRRDHRDHVHFATSKALAKRVLDRLGE